MAYATGLIEEPVKRATGLIEEPPIASKVSEPKPVYSTGLIEEKTPPAKATNNVAGTGFNKPTLIVLVGGAIAAVFALIVGSRK